MNTSLNDPAGSTEPNAPSELHLNSDGGDTVAHSLIPAPRTSIRRRRASPYTGDYNHYYRDTSLSAKEVEMTIENYAPYGIPHATWNEVSAFTRKTATDYNPTTRLETLFILRITVTFVVWALEVAALDIGPELFHPMLVERFIATHTGGTDASKRRTEQRLKRIAAAATAGKLLPAVSRGEPALAQPYTLAEAAQQDSWAATHPQKWRRRDSAILLTRGRGGGLEALEMVAASVDDLVDIGGHTTIQVHGLNPRTVPLFDEQAVLLRAAIDHYKIEGYLLSEHSRGSSKLLSAHQLRPALGKPKARRLRSTWIVRHLNARAPLPEFLAAAGLTSTSTLNRYMQFVTPTPGAVALLAGMEVAR